VPGRGETDLKFTIITGLSGAGKTEAIRSFEDFGYFCVDNLPPALIPRFAEMCAGSGGEVQRVALVSDIRGGLFFDHMFDSLRELEAGGFHYNILFLEATDDELIKRFKETRRRHPLAPTGGIIDGIRAERCRLEELRGRASKIIDTTDMKPADLRKEIARSYLVESEPLMNVTVISFGFKNGLPLDADLVFDIRFLPNPHYVETLRPHTGEDKAVMDYVFKWPVARQFMKRLHDLISFLLPHYVKEGKSQLIVGIGCTGGRHRSVAVAIRLGEFIRKKGFPVVVEHRDIKIS